MRIQYKYQPLSENKIPDASEGFIETRDIFSAVTNETL